MGRQRVRGQGQTETSGYSDEVRCRDRELGSQFFPGEPGARAEGQNSGRVRPRVDADVVGT